MTLCAGISCLWMAILWVSFWIAICTYIFWYQMLMPTRYFVYPLHFNYTESHLYHWNSAPGATAGGSAIATDILPILSLSAWLSSQQERHTQQQISQLQHQISQVQSISSGLSHDLTVAIRDLATQVQARAPAEPGAPGTTPPQDAPAEVAADGSTATSVPPPRTSDSKRSSPGAMQRLFHSWLPFSGTPDADTGSADSAPHHDSHALSAAHFEQQLASLLRVQAQAQEDTLVRLSAQAKRRLPTAAVLFHAPAADWVHGASIPWHSAAGQHTLQPGQEYEMFLYLIEPEPLPSSPSSGMAAPGTVFTVTADLMSSEQQAMSSCVRTLVTPQPSSWLIRLPRRVLTTALDWSPRVVQRVVSGWLPAYALRDSEDTARILDAAGVSPHVTRVQCFHGFEEPTDGSSTAGIELRLSAPGLRVLGGAVQIHARLTWVQWWVSHWIGMATIMSSTLVLWVLLQLAPVIALATKHGALHWAWAWVSGPVAHLPFFPAAAVPKAAASRARVASARSPALALRSPAPAANQPEHRRTAAAEACASGRSAAAAASRPAAEQQPLLATPERLSPSAEHVGQEPTPVPSVGSEINDDDSTQSYAWTF